MIQRARTNARLAGIGELITFEVKDVAQLTNPLPKGPYGTVLSNPPYGERLDSEPALIALHSLLGRIMKNQFGGWNLSLFSASPDLLSCLQLRAVQGEKRPAGLRTEKLPRCRKHTRQQTGNGSGRLRQPPA